MYTLYNRSRGYRTGRVTMLGTGRPRTRVSIPGTGTLSMELKWPGNEPDYSPLSSSAIKNMWSYSSSEPYIFMLCTEKNNVFIHTGSFKGEFCAAEWTASSVALQQLVSSAPRPLRTGLTWFLQLTSTAEQTVSHGATQYCSYEFVSRFKDRDPLQDKRVLYNMFWCNCHNFDSGQTHSNNANLLVSH